MKRLIVVVFLFLALIVGQTFVSTVYQSNTTVAEKNAATDLYAFQLNCTVKVHCDTGGWGSGVWVAPHIILTAKHVVEYCSEVDIELYNGRKLKATQFVLDRDDDLALIFIDFTSEYYALLGSKPLVGQEVTMVGSPLDAMCNFNLTKGHVSALIMGEVPEEYDPEQCGVPDYIVDCFGAPGNSGGPVFRGRQIIGLCIWGLNRQGSSMVLIADTTNLDVGLRSTF